MSEANHKFPANHNLDHHIATLSILHCLYHALDEAFFGGALEHYEPIITIETSMTPKFAAVFDPGGYVIRDAAKNDRYMTRIAFNSRSFKHDFYFIATLMLHEQIHLYARVIAEVYDRAAPAHTKKNFVDIAKKFGIDAFVTKEGGGHIVLNETQKKCIQDILRRLNVPQYPSFYKQ